MVALHPDLAPQPSQDHHPQPTERYVREKMVWHADLEHGPFVVALAVTRCLESGTDRPRWYGTDETLANLAHYGGRSTVVPHRKELERIGFLVRTGRRPNGRVEYAVRYDALRERRWNEAERNEEYHRAREEASQLEAQIVRTETCSPEEAEAFLRECRVVAVDAVLDLWRDEDVERAVVETIAARKARKIRNPAGYLLAVLRKATPAKWHRYLALRASSAMRRRERRGPRQIADVGFQTGEVSESEHKQARGKTETSEKNIGGSGSEGRKPPETDTTSRAETIHLNAEGCPDTPSGNRLVVVGGTVSRKRGIQLNDLPPAERIAHFLRETDPEAESPGNGRA